MKKWFKRILAILSILLVAFLLLITTVFCPDKVVNNNKTKIQAMAQEQIGRTIDWSEVDASYWPPIGVVLRDFTLTGPNNIGTSAQFEKLEVRISLLKAILTLGTSIEVTSVELTKPKFRTTLYHNGQWDFQDILDTLAKNSTKGEIPEESDGDTGPFAVLETLSVSKFIVQEGSLQVFDEANDTNLSATHLSLALQGLKRKGNLDLALSTLLGVDAKGGSQLNTSPFELQLKVPKVDTDSFAESIEDFELTTKLETLDVSPWARLLDPESILARSGTLSFDLQSDYRSSKDILNFKLKAAGKSLKLGTADTQGKGFSINANILGDRSMKAQRIALRKVDVTAPSLKAQGALFGDTKQRGYWYDSHFDVDIDDLNTVLSYLPSQLAGLPPELTMTGPFHASVHVDQSYELNIDATQSFIAYSDLFSKASGLPFRFATQGSANDNGLSLKSIALVLDKLNVHGALEVPSQGSIKGSLKSSPFTMASLSSLSPKVAREAQELPSGTTSFTLTFDEVNKHQSVDAHMKLMGTKVDLSTLHVSGDATMDLTLTPKADHTPFAFDIDFDQMAFRDDAQQDGLNKKAGTPLDLHISGKVADDNLNLSHAALKLASSNVGVKGTVSNYASENPALDMKTSQCTINLADLKHLLPGFSDFPSAGTLTCPTSISGPLNALMIGIRGLKWVSPFGETRGDILVQNGNKARMQIDLEPLKINLNQLAFLDAGYAQLSTKDHFAGSIHGVLSDSSSDSLEVRISDLTMRDSNVKGSMTLKNVDAPHFNFVLASKHLAPLDFDVSTASTAKNDTGDANSNSDGLSKDTRALLKKVSGTGTLSAASFVLKDVRMTDASMALTMKKGQLHFDTLKARAYGGTLDWSGSNFDLASAKTAFDLKGDASNIRIEQVLSDLTSIGPVVSGFSADNLKIRGQGLTKETLLQNLSGTVSLNSNELKLKTLDLLGGFEGPLKGASGILKSGGLKLPGGRLKTKGTSLVNVKATLKVDRGRYELTKPMSVSSPVGPIVFKGGGKLDGSLDSNVQLTLSRNFLATNFGQHSASREIPLNFRLGGTWLRPRIIGLDTKQLVQAVAVGAASKAVGEKGAAMIEKGKKKISSAKSRVKSETKKATDQAVTRAKSEVKKAKTKAKKKAKDTAKKLLDGLF